MAPRLALSIAVAAAGSAARAAAGAAPADAAEVVARVQAAYDATQDLKASFKQVWSNPAYGQTRTAYGYVYLKKGGKMRWNYSWPDRTTLLSDGATLWVHEHADRQVFRQPLDESALPTAVTFLTGQGRLAEEFSAALDPASPYAEPGHVVLRLTPRTPTARYQHLVLVVSTSDHLVRQSVIVDHQGGANHLRFWDVRRDTRVPDARFTFTPPADAHVIEPRKLIEPPPPAPAPVP